MEAVAAGHAAHLHIGVIPFISGQMLSAALKRLQARERRLTVTIHEGTSDQLLLQLRDHGVDIVIGRASSAIDLGQVSFEVLYQQQPRMIASRRLAAKLARTALDWHKLHALDWILGAPHTPMREQVTDLFLSAGIAPPVPIVESYSSKLIGEMIASSDEAVSIVPADIAEELVRIAGVAIVPYSLVWTLPPIALFTRAADSRSPARDLLVEALREVCRETYGTRSGKVSRATPALNGPPDPPKPVVHLDGFPVRHRPRAAGREAPQNLCTLGSQHMVSLAAVIAFGRPVGQPLLVLIGSGIEHPRIDVEEVRFEMTFALAPHNRPERTPDRTTRPAPSTSRDRPVRSG